MRNNYAHTAYTHHISVLWICWRAFVYASAFSREGKMSACDPTDGKCFLEKRFRWKLCLMADTWLSAMPRSTSTHCWRLAAFAARILSVSPDAQVIVNVRESSSLGLTVAPARCSCKQYYSINIFNVHEFWMDILLTCQRGVLPIWIVGLSMLVIALVVLKASKSTLRLVLEMLWLSEAMLFIDDDDQLLVGRKYRRIPDWASTVNQRYCQPADSWKNYQVNLVKCT